MKILVRGPGARSAVGPGAPRRSVLRAPLLGAMAAGARPASAMGSKPAGTLKLREFLAGVRLVSVAARVRLWQDGRWTATHQTGFPGDPPQARPGGLLRNDFNEGLGARGAAAAGRALRAWRPPGGGPPGPGAVALRVLDPSAPPGEYRDVETRAQLRISVDMLVREAPVSVPAAAGAPDLRVFGVADRAEYHRLGIWDTPERRVWPPLPSLAVEAAHAAEVEERVVARLDAVVADAVALILTEVG